MGVQDATHRGAGASQVVGDLEAALQGLTSCALARSIQARGEGEKGQGGNAAAT